MKRAAFKKSSCGRIAVFEKSSCVKRAVFNIDTKLEQQDDSQQGLSMTLLPTGGAIYYNDPL